MAPRVRARRLALCLLLCACAAACGSEAGDDAPTSALRRFLEAMERSQEDEGALKEAYGLMSSSAREKLRERADLAGTLAGRELEPWEMIVQGRFRLRFSPREPGGMRERIDGDHAVVTVRGATEAQRADVPMVREGGHWRVDLAIP